MKDLIKINLSDAHRDIWPAFLEKAVLDKSQFMIEVFSADHLLAISDYLFFKEGVLQYHTADLGVMAFSFEEIYSYHQRQAYAITREPLAKALGIKGGEKPSIWDTTCGTGKDSLLIHFFGGRLTAFERHPAIYLLLLDAKRRFPLAFDIVYADAKKLYSNSMPIGERPEVIYYDPMYPEKTGSKKSALPRKEMRIFKDVVGEDLDSADFLEWALITATKRVVVKRALGASEIKAKPTARYEGKSTRYDMYKIFD
jgi:16S rRNA (guanine1516-N2)-methyltransferase